MATTKRPNYVPFSSRRLKTGEFVETPMFVFRYDGHLFVQHAPNTPIWELTLVTDGELYIALDIIAQLQRMEDRQHG
jgi:hypothetical protein